MSYYATSEAYACGQDGILLRTENDGTDWQVVPTGTTGQFIDVYFRTQDEGIAIIETSGGEGQIWKTIDAGITWTLLSDPGDDYNALYGYENSGSTAKIVAVGQASLVSRVIIQSGNFGMIPLNGPAVSTDLNTAWATTTTAGALWIYVAGNSSTMYVTTDGTASFIIWTNIATGISGGDENFVRFSALAMTSGTDPCISGTLLNTNGKLYSVYKAANSSSHAVAIFSSPTPASNNFADVQPAGTATDLVTFNNTDMKLYKIVLSSGAATTTATAITATVGTYSVITTMSVANSTAMLGGTRGALEKSAFNIVSPAVTFTDVSDNITNVTLNNVEFSGSGGKVYAAGNDGNVVQQASAGVWKIFKTSTAEDLYAQHYNTTTTGLACGENGTLISYSVGSTSFTTTAISTGVTEALFDITRSGNAVYMAGEDGKLLVCNNITVGTPVINVSTVSTAGDLNGVAFVSGSGTTAIAVGAHAHVRWCFGQTSMANTRVYTPALKGMHFTDASNGYAVGDRFTIRYTNDGGNTWNVAIPSSLTVMGAGLPNLNCAFNHANGTATIGGTARYLGRVSAGVATQDAASFVAGTILAAVDFTSNGYGVIAGGGGGNSVTAHSTDYGVSWSVNGTVVSGVSFRAVKAFYRNSQFSYFAAGTNTSLRYWNGSSFTTTACTLPGGLTGVTFTDFYFHDDINGYLVGNKGVILKTDAFAWSTGTGLFTAGNWVLKRSDDELLGQTDSSKIGTSSIAFATRYNGFVGGTYDNTSTPTVQPGYARLLRDESDIFSTYFWYDKLGRIVLCQNSRQYAENIKRYSYVKYDALGRVNEAGEKYENDPTDLQMASIFGTYIANHFNPKIIDNDTLSDWLTETSGLRIEVTRTYYDTINPDIASHFPINFDQINLRKRMVHVTYSDTLNAEDSIYNHATHYSYDIHGGVNTLLQDNPQRYAPGGAISSQRYKRLDYEYDQVSAKMNEVAFERDSADMMLHRYEYDGDNRLQTVETSTDNVVWDQDAKYIYYLHGPLARMELGENSVQGVDYAYTLQGWIKGVNSNWLDTTRDMGHDADTLTGNVNALFAKDAFSYSLTYYEGDYAPIDTSKWNNVKKRWEAEQGGSDFSGDRQDLFNGNISAMVTSITDTNGTALPQGVAYNYDQLHRLLYARAWTNVSKVNNVWGFTGTHSNFKYFNSFTYDANGNILSQARMDQAGGQIEDLTYNYAKNGAGDVIQNRLYHVNDNIGSGSYAGDIDDQGSFNSALSSINTANNYEYDKEGRLVRDSLEEIDTLKWIVTGKLKTVQRTPGSSKKNLKFDYDAMGQRVAKHVYDDSWNWEKSTYYVRSPQGLIMATYDQEVVSSVMNYTLKERAIYGQSRLGLYTDTIEMIGSSMDTTYLSHNVEFRQYELSNHLGNVICVVTDLAVGKDWSSPGDSIIENYHADIVTATDYYAFGVTMQERNFSLKVYRYGYNGKEREDDLVGEGNSYNYDSRILDTRLGRWFVIDAKAAKCQYESPYSYVGNSPMVFVDPNGEEKIIVIGGGDKEGKDKYKFVNTALLRLKTLTTNKDGTEPITLLITDIYLTQADKDNIDKYVKTVDAAYKGPVTVVYVSSGDQITNYVNSKTKEGTELSQARKDDQVSELSFYGHGYRPEFSSQGPSTGSFEPAHCDKCNNGQGEQMDGPNGDKDRPVHEKWAWGKEDVDKLNKGAFATGAVINYTGICNAATPPEPGNQAANGTTNLAQYTAKKLGVETRGWFGRVDYSEIYGKGKGNPHPNGIGPATNGPIGGSKSDPFGGGASEKKVYDKTGTEVKQP
ncbi:MAG TPA: RHS repeat-associated core domain-containing protein [Bacteroidia bacterium]|nr:RHS repeat-associated core domain-containing protein [Bacteroidia bacterium]